MSATDLDSWPVPMVLGSRLCWRWEGQNVTIPLVKVKPVYTDHRAAEDINEYGWMVELPTENGATVELAWDPNPEAPDNPDRLAVSMWLYVRHPEFDYLIDAQIERADGATYWIAYDPECDGENCAGCEHGFNQWWEYVTGPQHVLDRLRWLGSLPLRVKPATRRAPHSEPADTPVMQGSQSIPFGPVDSAHSAGGSA
jgi:hypothetical protein